MFKARYKILLAFTLSVTFSVYSQEKELELDPVTITSSLNQKKISQTGRNIIVLKGDQISKLPVNSIDDLLRYMPGIEVQARGPMGTQSDFVIRGSTFQQVLVVLDGLRLNDPLTGHFNSYIPIAPAEIDRIEILKGAASAVYGSEAVGGVIHIITKSFAAKSNASRSIHAKITAGQHGLLNTDAGTFYTNGKTSFGGGILSNNSRGQQQRGAKGFFYLHTASLSFSRRLGNNWMVGIRSAYDNRNFGAQNFYTTALSDTAEETVKSFWNQVQVQHQKGKGKLSVNVGYKTAEDEYTFNKTTTANYNKSRLLQALGVYEYKFSGATSVTIGSQFYNRIIRSNDRGNHEEKQTAAFLILNQNIGSLHIVPALRLDHNERSGTELIPQVAIAYQIAKLQFRGSAGKTFRDADFTERFNNYNKVIIARGQRVGNPDLDAEHSFSYEAGSDYFASKELKLSATFFQRFHKKLIDYVITSSSSIPRNENLFPAANYAFAKNISKVTTTGAEVDVHHLYNINERTSLWSTAGFVWIHSTSSEAAPSFYILSHARFLTNFSVRFATTHFSIAVNGLYKSRQPQAASSINANVSADYFVMNVKGEWNVWKDKAGLFTQVDNVFNENYSNLLGTVMPRRWLMVGARITL